MVEAVKKAGKIKSKLFMEAMEMSKDKDLELLATYVKVVLFAAGQAEVSTQLEDCDVVHSYEGEIKRICDQYCKKPVKK